MKRKRGDRYRRRVARAYRRSLPKVSLYEAFGRYLREVTLAGFLDWRRSK